jgi:hypothetical protein
MIVMRENLNLKPRGGSVPEPEGGRGGCVKDWGQTGRYIGIRPVCPRFSRYSIRLPQLLRG